MENDMSAQGRNDNIAVASKVGVDTANRIYKILQHFSSKAARDLTYSLLPQKTRHRLDSEAPYTNNSVWTFFHCAHYSFKPCFSFKG